MENIMQKISKKTMYEVLLKEWLMEKRPFVKESTYSNYWCLINNHIMDELGQTYIEDINNKSLQNFIIKKMSSPYNLSGKTLKNIMLIIKSSIKKAINEGVIDYIDLTFVYPKETKPTKIKVFGEKEQKRLVKYCKNDLNNRNLGILLSLLTGIRIGELAALRWKHIDLSNKIISVEQTLQRIQTENQKTKVIITTPKTNASIRSIPINQELLYLLKQLNTNEDYFVLSGNDKYIEPRTYRRYYKKILQLNKIQHLNFHSLRHSFATNCINLKVSPKIVSEILGHSDIKMTLQLYVHPSMKDKNRCLDLVYKSLL